MTFAEAIPILAKYGKLKLPWTLTGAYIALNKDYYNVLSYFYPDGLIVSYDLTLEDITTTDWEVVE